MKECKVDGCEKPARNVRGWCGAHYSRWLKWGDVRAHIPLRAKYKTPAESFAARTRRDGECLIWTGALSVGYGQIGVSGEVVPAHRYAWEQANGPIPEGEYVDHVCHNRACVNAQHLRLASNAENQRNRAGAQVNSSSGYRNVHRSHEGFYEASVKKDGKKHYGGYFRDPAEASVAAEALRAQLFGDFAGKG